MNKLISLVYGRTPIEHSNITSIFTKYGMYQAKVYKDAHQEYLALMSQNFFDLKTPIVYIHSDSYTCGHLASSQLDLALKMISKEHGLLIYYSNEGRKIDTLLQDINARKLQTKTDVMHKTDIKSKIKVYKKEYYTLSFILKDLNLSKIQLVSNDINAIESAVQLGINITKQVPTISYGYGRK
ncbi:MAG: hypothetical protein K0U47_06770 [Epsilonproteobacteria bacterium]|nr:hypothetical protein [Campylobacterota bacterium]